MMESEHDDSSTQSKMDGQPMTHDSMVTVRLSEPPTLTVDTNVLEHTNRHTFEHTKAQDAPATLQEDEEESTQEGSPRITMLDPNGNEVTSPSGSESVGSTHPESRRGSDGTEESAEEVNWEELEKTEEQEPRDEGSDDSTALLLARLEQENNLLATNPKSGIVKTQIEQQSKSKSRPPSMQHLKRLVNGPTPSALRYSMIPAPPMTDLEFYAALVQDYTRTAQCLPTLLSKKIRSGVPPPLRGVVWQSMSGARDRLLEDQFDRLCGESSPYEGIIGKDLGRSFPGVEMFREPEGDGQRMLGRVLKCFSLYDQKIGYCQGLGFLVGPLLMHMGDKQAFCVLVRLMEHYDLRNCYLPDLSGLHVRIHQFGELLKQHFPILSSHLDVLQIEPAYVSQWFLSFFAVTCPLPMLFRIYDVIFAEGASETIMRVALSLMRKNEQKILACTEFEDVMQLLLSRGLWDCYHYNADEFVNDFVSLTGIVTHESLQALEESYKESRAANAAATSETVGSAAARFLGRLWAGSNASTKSTNLSPGLTAPSRPISFLRRSPSKQSIASTMNSMEGGGTDSILSSTTEGTSVSRDSSNTDGSSIREQSVVFPAAAPKSNKDKNLHGQIEDLLTALSEMQRDHAILAMQLQREREEREEDRHAVKSLIDGLKKKTSSETVNTYGSETSFETLKPVDPKPEEEGEDEAEEAEAEAGAAKSWEESISIEPIVAEDPEVGLLSPPVTEDDLSRLLDIVEERLNYVKLRRSSMLTTKSQLRDELARAKEQLTIEVSKTQDLSRQLTEQQQEINNLKDDVKEGHIHIRNSHAEKQRLEKQIHELRVRRSTATTPDGSKDTESEWPSRQSSHGGLREFKLGRSNSNLSHASAFNARTSSLGAAALIAKESETPSPISTPPETKPEVDFDALVLELVQAKTAEAVAKQEAEEAKSKLESLRKMLGIAPGDSPNLGHRPSPSQPMIERSAMMVGFKGKPAPKIETQSPVSAASGGFWGGWGKRAVSGEKISASGS